MAENIQKYFKLIILYCYNEGARPILFLHSYAIFVLYIDINMFLKPENSDMENGFKKNVPRKNSYTAETGTWKRHFLKGTRITRPEGWFTSLKFFCIQFFILKRPTFLNKKNAFLSFRGSEPPTPLADCPAKNASFFDVLPKGV